MVTLLTSIIVFILLIILLVVIFSKRLRRQSSSTILLGGSIVMIAFGISSLVLRHFLIGLGFFVVSIVWGWRGVKLRGTK